MSSDVAEIQEVLLVLIPKIIDCKEPLSAQELGNSLYGLQSIDFVTFPELVGIIVIYLLARADVILNSTHYEDKLSTALLVKNKDALIKCNMYEKAKSIRHRATDTVAKQRCSEISSGTERE